MTESEAFMLWALEGLLPDNLLRLGDSFEFRQRLLRRTIRDRNKKVQAEYNLPTQSKVAPLRPFAKVIYLNSRRKETPREN